MGAGKADTLQRGAEGAELTTAEASELDNHTIQATVDTRPTYEQKFDDEILDSLNRSLPDDPRQALDFPEKRVTLAGDPSVGRVNVYAEEQYIPGMHQRSIDHVIRYQLAIWEQLERDRPSVIFRGGHHDKMQLDDPRFAEHLEQIRSAFPGGKIPHEAELTDAQRRELGRAGAAYIYAALNPNDTTIMATITYEDSARIAERLKWLALDRAGIERGLKKLIPEYERTGVLTEELRDLDEKYALITEQERLLRFDHLERLAMDEVTKYLKENPGAEVAMIFGSASRWSREDFPNQSAKELPEVSEYRWDKLSAQSIDTEFRELYRRFPQMNEAQKRNAIEVQVALLQSAEQVSPLSWDHLLSAEAQIGALPKMWNDPKAASSEALLAAIQRTAFTQEVRELAVQLYQDRQGPFSN